jgi:hypothetical protein
MLLAAEASHKRNQTPGASKANPTEIALFSRFDFA